jgi:hypothetical protein
MALVAIASAVFAYAFMGQTHTAGQGTHLALVKSLSQGTAIVDETAFQVGDQPASDLSRFDGHWYANKPPGLAFVILPLYLALDEAGFEPVNTRMYWALGLLGSVLPAALLLLTVRWLGEQLAQGFGTLTAVTLGLGTLVLPFASVLFAHLLAAALLFGAFALLWRERRRAPRLGLVALAGLLGGYAVTSEYVSGIGVVVLGVYALLGAQPVSRALSFGAGALLGIVPLLAYDWWAFGSPLHLSYESSDLGEGINAPSFPLFVQLHFDHWGLLQISPALALGWVGAFLMYRAGQRAEGVVCAAIPALYLLFNSTLTHWPSGGTAGTRYVIASMPFLALPLALTYNRFPLVTSALAVPSVCILVAMAASKPLIAWDGNVLARLTSSDGSAETVADFGGITGWYDIVPFYVAVALSAVCAVRASPLRISARELPMAVAAVLGWGVVALAGPQLLASDRLPAPGSAMLVLLAAIAAALGVSQVSRPPPRHA